jgi:hypothetical protein
MNDGVGYLFEKVYSRMSAGCDVRLSELDFGAFEQKDVESFDDLYSNVFERNYRTADGIGSALRAAPPVCGTPGFV